MTFVYGSHVLAQALIAFIFFCTTSLAAADLDELEGLLLQAVTDAMHSAHLTLKEMAFHMGIDEKQLRRQLNREPHQHLALLKIFRAPFAWWCFFGPTLIALVARKRFAELTEDFRRERV